MWASYFKTEIRQSKTFKAPAGILPASRPVLAFDSPKQFLPG
jgi:hypothetical protein